MGLFKPEMTMRMALAIVLVLLVSEAALAKERSLSFSQLSRASNEEWHRCYAQVGTSSMAAAMCSALDLDRQSKLLSRVEAEVRARIGNKARVGFNSLERRWDNLIYQKCRVAELGQSGAGMNEIDEFKFCLAYEVSERIVWLERRYRLRR
jgi:hypothetical protein